MNLSSWLHLPPAAEIPLRIFLAVISWIALTRIMERLAGRDPDEGLARHIERFARRNWRILRVLRLTTRHGWIAWLILVKLIWILWRNQLDWFGLLDVTILYLILGERQEKDSKESLPDFADQLAASAPGDMSSQPRELLKTPELVRGASSGGEG